MAGTITSVKKTKNLLAAIEVVIFRRNTTYVQLSGGTTLLEMMTRNAAP
jgi:hypothetical protein